VETGKRKSETGNRRLETGNPEAGDQCEWRSVTCASSARSGSGLRFPVL